MIEQTMVGCPSCLADGPHKRLGVDAKGLSVFIECRRCALAWRVTG